MKIIHLSDLHFGTHTSEIEKKLRNVIDIVKPEIIVVSGDFTQVGSEQEFKAAQNFLASLPQKSFCVPGNHDISRFNLWERLLNPYKNYKKYIDDNLCPLLETDEVIIAGINSARRILPHWNWANGAISDAQLDYLEKTFSGKNDKKKICVFHHPIHKAQNAPLDTKVYGADKAMNKMAALEIDLVLTGHVHHASITPIGSKNNKTLYVSASTALSTRIRTQENGFNVIDITQKDIRIDTYIHDGKTFSLHEEYRHIF